MNKIILTMILGIFLLQSCLEDKGNYSYAELTPIEIDSASLASSYRITQLDYLVINPVVRQGEDDSNLEYEWRVFQSSGMPNTETGTIINDVVGSERNLNWQVTTPPGIYTLSFTVSDKQNGVSEIVSRTLNIESFAPVGLMIMHGDSDSTDVSILVNNRIVSDVTIDSVKHNIFSITNGHRIPGAPGQIAYSANPQNVYVFTEGSFGGYRTRGSDLEVLDTYADMFTEPLSSAEIDFQAYGVWSYNDLLINNGEVYFASQASTTFTQFGVPAFGVEYYAEPFIGVQQYGYYYGIFYDRLNRRFLYLDYNRNVQTFSEPTTGAFNMNDVGMDMVYAEHGFNNRWYCVMHTPGDETDNYVYVCDFSRTDDGNRGSNVYDINASSDINKATAFAVGNRSELLYYATETEVKQCNYTNDGSSTIRYTLPNDLSAEGYKINMLYMFKQSDSDNNGKLLYIGIYNENTGEGKLLESQIVETSGEILEDSIKIYEGFKKISHMAYKSL